MSPRGGIDQIEALDDATDGTGRTLQGKAVDIDEACLV